MNWETSPVATPPCGKGKTKMINVEKIYLPDRGGSFDPAVTHAKSSPVSVGGFMGDDPRVIAALEGYIEDLRNGRPPSQDEFLARHAEIADALGQCLSAVEFIQAAAVQLGGPQAFSTADPTDSLPRLRS